MKAVIVAALIASLGVPAAAQEVSFEVQYRDLNLATAEGQQKLDRRIETAARKACGFGETTTGTRIRSKVAQQCVTELRTKARAQFATIIANEEKGG